MDLKWNADQFLVQLSAWTSNKSALAANVLAEEIRRTIGHQGRPGYHSEPGFPPFRQSGELQRSVIVRKQDIGVVRGFLRAVSLSEQVYEVAVTAPHGPWLEWGTYKMLPRPFMMTTVFRMQSTMQSMLKAGG